MSCKLPLLCGQFQFLAFLCKNFENEILDFLLTFVGFFQIPAMYHKPGAHSGCLGFMDFVDIFQKHICSAREESFVDVRLHLLNLPSQIARFPFNVLSVG